MEETTPDAETPQPGDEQQPAPEPTLKPIPTFDDDPDAWPLFAIVADELVYRGGLRVSLKFPSRLAEEVDAVEGRRAKIAAILTGRGDTDVLNALGDLDNAERVVLEQKWFQAYAQREDALLGEAFGSSGS